MGKNLICYGNRKLSKHGQAEYDRIFKHDKTKDIKNAIHKTKSNTGQKD